MTKQLLFDSSLSLSFQEMVLVKLSKFGLKKDILLKIYNYLDPIQNILVKIAKKAKLDLFFYSEQDKYTFEKITEMTFEDLGTLKIPEILASFKLSGVEGNQLLEISTKVGFYYSSLKISTEEFISKTRNAIIKLDEYGKILEKISQINPSLRLILKSNVDILSSSGNYLKEYLDREQSFGEIKLIFPKKGSIYYYDPKTLLEILPNGNYRFKHLDQELDENSLDLEIKRLININQQRQKLINLCKEKYGESIKIYEFPKKEEDMNLFFSDIAIQSDNGFDIIIKNDQVVLKDKFSIENFKLYIANLKSRPPEYIHYPQVIPFPIKKVSHRDC